MASPNSSRPSGVMTASTGEEVRAYKKTRLLSSLDETITLVVGKDKEQKTFIVHKNVLCAASPFFEAACKPQWMNDDRVLKLPEDDPLTVKIMVNWTYHNEICIPHKLKYSEYFSSTVELLVKLYVIGEKYQMPNVRNDTVDALYLWMEDCGNGFSITADAVNYAWQNESGIRALLIKLVKDYCIPGSLESLEGEEINAKSVPSGFWSALAIHFAKEQDSCERPINWAYCFCATFHSHRADFDECPEKKSFIIEEA